MDIYSLSMLIKQKLRQKDQDLTTSQFVDAKNANDLQLKVQNKFTTIEEYIPNIRMHIIGNKFSIIILQTTFILGIFVFSCIRKY